MIISCICKEEHKSFFMLYSYNSKYSERFYLGYPSQVSEIFCFFTCFIFKLFFFSIFYLAIRSTLDLSFHLLREIHDLFYFISDFYVKKNMYF